jgi:hypothetical protein
MISSADHLIEKLHITHIIVALKIGGAEQMLSRLAIKTMNESQLYDCSVISLTNIGEIGKNLRSKRVPVYCLEMNGLMGLPLALYRLYKKLQNLNPAIVQTWMIHADLIGGLVAFFVKTPIIIWGIRTTDYSKESALTRFIRWVCARLSFFIPDRIICAAEAARLSHAAIGYDPQRMLTISIITHSTKQ